MRKRYGWCGWTAAVGVTLGWVGFQARGQQGDPPVLRLPELPIVAGKDPVRPGFPNTNLPAVPALKAPPTLPENMSATPYVLPPPNVSETAPAPRNSGISPARLDTNGASSSAPDVARAAKHESTVKVEWVGPTTVRLQKPLACQIIVRNTGTAAVHGVTVRHRLNPGTTCSRTEPPAARERDDLIWTIGALAPGQQHRLELQLVASQRGALDCQATVTFASSAGQLVQVQEPMLQVRARLPQKVIAGDQIDLQCTVTNPGDGAAELVKVKAMLPDGVESSHGRMVELEVGNLGPKETRTLQVACVAKTGGSQKCMVLATADGNLSASDHAVTEVLEAKLDLAIGGPKLRYLDRHAVYTFKVSNPGSATANNVTLNEVVPAGFKFHSATAGGRWDDVNKTVSWQFGELPPGQSREVSLDVVAAAMGEHRLQALVTANRGIRSEASTLTRIEGTSSLVIELVDVDDPVEVGSETAYEIRITNAGTKMESNVELACTLPDQVELRGAKSLAGIQHRAVGREVVFDPLPRLAPKADVIYRVIVRGVQAGDVRFRARVRADGLPEPVLREESTRFYNDR